MTDKTILGREGSARRSAMLPARSRLSSEAALRAGREPIGLWPLLLWAYRKEMVRFTCGMDFSMGVVGHGSWFGYLSALGIDAGEDQATAMACCHDDALLVHAAVLRTIAAAREEGEASGDEGERGREAFQLLILHPEKGYPPTWDIPEPVWRCVPIKDKRGRPIVGCEVKNRPFCAVQCVGEVGELGLVRNWEEWHRTVARARGRYSRFIALLGEVIHRIVPEHAKLKRWRLTGLGIAPEPWSRGASRDGA